MSLSKAEGDMFSSKSKGVSSSLSSSMEYKKELKYVLDEFDNSASLSGDSKSEDACSSVRETSADKGQAKEKDKGSEEERQDCFHFDSGAQAIACEEYQNDLMGDFDDEEFDEEVFACSQELGTADMKFDETIGVLEELLMDDSRDGINQVITSFCLIHCDEFDSSTDENKLSYTDIFNEYTTVVETYVNNFLSKHVADFDMTEFLEQISGRSEEVNQDLYDILMSFTDFNEFKALMFHTKNEKKNSGSEGIENKIITATVFLKSPTTNQSTTSITPSCNVDISQIDRKES